MDRISSFFILFFLCFPLHACNARRRGNDGFGQKLYSLSKEGEKVKLDADSTGKTIDPKESNVFEKEMKHKEEAISGDEIVESSSHMGLLKATRLNKDSRWEARRVLELGSHDKGLEGTYNRVHEEREQTDYESPHGKTPIHN